MKGGDYYEGENPGRNPFNQVTSKKSGQLLKYNVSPGES